MRRHTLRTLGVALLVSIVAGITAQAGGVKYKNEDGDYVKLGGRIQLQYHLMDPADGDATDELLFRRFRPYIEGSIHEDWKGKFQWDMGKSSLAVKDAYFEYTGCENSSIKIGNVTFPFSREQLTSSKKLALVERTFVGDHNYGVPDRQAGLHASAKIMDGMLELSGAVVKGAIDPSSSKLDFDTVVNSDDDFLEGNMAGARAEIFPLGYFKPEQGDFKRDLKCAFAVAGFGWANDDDNNSGNVTNDIDKVTGVEVSAAVRGGGLSIDAQYNSIKSELSDTSVTHGLYQNGETTLDTYAIEGGYMVLPGKVEVVAGYSSMDADNFASAWNRTEVGLNYYVKKQDIKYQITYRKNDNYKGKDGVEEDEVFVQAQYVF